jgi:hypothetical protein
MLGCVEWDLYTAKYRKRDRERERERERERLMVGEERKERDEGSE